MARRVPYKLSNGDRVPSVTTIINRFKDSGGLIYWANKQGLDGLTLDEARTPAAVAGTLAHSLVEAHVNSWEEPELQAPSDVIAKARNAFENFLRWAEQSRLDFVHTEHSLVSERHRFGGRFDAVAKQVDGRYIMVDFKTGSLYLDHLLQVAAYRMLWNETYPEYELADAAHLLSFKRETADFSHSYFGGLGDETDAFLRMRSLYDCVKKIEKRVK